MRVIVDFFNQTESSPRASIYRTLSRRPSDSSAFSQSTHSRPQTSSTFRTPPRPQPENLPNSLPLELFDSLRPPSVYYGEPLIQKRIFRSKCNITAISPNGALIGWFRRDQYEIFDTTGCNVVPVCSGKFNGQRYYYGQSGKARSLKQPNDRNFSAFCCAAISDLYVAIATQEGMLLIFAARGASQGARPGQWLSYTDLSDNVIEKVLFTPAGDELLAVITPKQQNNSRKLVVCSTCEFAKAPGITDEEIKPIQMSDTARWKEDSVSQVPAAGLSSDGRKLAIGSSHNSQGVSAVQILQKSQNDGQWHRKVKGPLRVVKIKESHSPGLTGLCLYHPQCFPDN